MDTNNSDFLPLLTISREKAERNLEDARNYILIDLANMRAVISLYHPLEMAKMSVWEERRVSRLGKNDMNAAASRLLPIIIQSILIGKDYSGRGMNRDVKKKDWQRLTSLSQDLTRKLVRYVDNLAAWHYISGTVSREDVMDYRESLFIHYFPGEKNAAVIDTERVFAETSLEKDGKVVSEVFGVKPDVLISEMDKIAKHSLVMIDELVAESTEFKATVELRTSQLMAEDPTIDEAEARRRVFMTTEIMTEKLSLEGRRDDYDLFRPEFISDLPESVYEKMSAEPGTCETEECLFKRGRWPATVYPFIKFNGMYFSFVAKYIFAVSSRLSENFLRLRARVEASANTVLESLFTPTDIDWVYDFDGNMIDVELLSVLSDVNPVTDPERWQTQQKRKSEEYLARPEYGHRMLIVDADDDTDEVEDLGEGRYWTSVYHLLNCYRDRDTRIKFYTDLFGEYNLGESDPLLEDIDDEDILVPGSIAGPVAPESVDDEEEKEILEDRLDFDALDDDEYEDDESRHTDIDEEEFDPKKVSFRSDDPMEKMQYSRIYDDTRAYMEEDEEKPVPVSEYTGVLDEDIYSKDDDDAYDDEDDVEEPYLEVVDEDDMAETRSDEDEEDDEPDAQLDFMDILDDFDDRDEDAVDSLDMDPEDDVTIPDWPAERTDCHRTETEVKAPETFEEGLSDFNELSEEDDNDVSEGPEFPEDKAEEEGLREMDILEPAEDTDLPEDGENDGDIYDRDVIDLLSEKLGRPATLEDQKDLENMLDEASRKIAGELSVEDVNDALELLEKDGESVDDEEDGEDEEDDGDGVFEMTDEAIDVLYGDEVLGLLGEYVGHEPTLEDKKRLYDMMDDSLKAEDLNEDDYNDIAKAALNILLSDDEDEGCTCEDPECSCHHHDEEEDSEEEDSDDEDSDDAESDDEDSDDEDSDDEDSDDEDSDDEDSDDEDSDDEDSDDEDSDDEDSDDEDSDDEDSDDGEPALCELTDEALDEIYSDEVLGMLEEYIGREPRIEDKRWLYDMMDDSLKAEDLTEEDYNSIAEAVLSILLSDDDEEETEVEDGDEEAEEENEDFSEEEDDEDDEEPVWELTDEAIDVLYDDEVIEKLTAFLGHEPELNDKKWLYNMMDDSLKQEDLSEEDYNAIASSVLDIVGSPDYDSECGDPECSCHHDEDEESADEESEDEESEDEESGDEESGDEESEDEESEDEESEDEESEDEESEDEESEDEEYDDGPEIFEMTDEAIDELYDDEVLSMLRDHVGHEPTLEDKKWLYDQMDDSVKSEDLTGEDYNAIASAVLTIMDDREEDEAEHLTDEITGWEEPEEDEISDEELDSLYDDSVIALLEEKLGRKATIEDKRDLYDTLDRSAQELAKGLSEEDVKEVLDLIENFDDAEDAHGEFGERDEDYHPFAPDDDHEETPVPAVEEETQTDDDGNPLYFFLDDDGEEEKEAEEAPQEEEPSEEEAPAAEGEGTVNFAFIDEEDDEEEKPVSVADEDEDAPEFFLDPSSPGPESDEMAEPEVEEEEETPSLFGDEELAEEPSGDASSDIPGEEAHEEAPAEEPAPEEPHEETEEKEAQDSVVTTEEVKVPETLTEETFAPDTEKKPEPDQIVLEYTDEDEEEEEEEQHAEAPDAEEILRVEEEPVVVEDDIPAPEPAPVEEPEAEEEKAESAPDPEEKKEEKAEPTPQSEGRMTSDLAKALFFDIPGIAPDLTPKSSESIVLEYEDEEEEEPEEETLSAERPERAVQEESVPVEEEEEDVKVFVVSPDAEMPKPEEPEESSDDETIVSTEDEEEIIEDTAEDEKPITLDLENPKYSEVIRQIAAMLGRNAGAFAEFLEHEERAVLDHFNQVIRQSWERQLSDGKDKMFSIFDYDLSVLLSKSKVYDELRLEELLNNAGAVMYSTGKESWNALMVYINRDYTVESAELRVITKDDFSAANWKIVSNIGQELMNRRMK